MGDERGRAGVVDEHVETAEFGGNAIEQPRHSRRNGDIALDPTQSRVAFGNGKGEVSMPALAASWPGEPERLGDVPEVGQHSAEIRREFGA